ncbi:MAG: protein kinase [Rhizobiales bacterium]|nr:protein kinase [Hyphomicrobiales bacterium]
MAEDIPAKVGPGTTLNGMFVIDERLAAGGMGEVYRGRNIATGDPVAIKVVLAELAKDETVVGLFFKEAKVLNTLHHPAIVRYSVFGIDPVVQRPYLVMEYVDGPSLAGVIDGQPMASGDARILLAQVASALDAAHKAGVIHRDISPDNIILPGGRVGAAKIIDFGIARATNIGAGTLLGGKFAGKYNFVSPEQLGLFGGEVTEVSDVYSLALVMVNALRGTPVDMNGTPLEVIEKRRSIPDLSDIDATLRPLLELMLQPDPAARTISMAEIADWLRSGEETLPHATRPPTTAFPRETLPPTSSTVPPTPTAPPPAAALSSRPPVEPTVVAPQTGRWPADESWPEDDRSSGPRRDEPVVLPPVPEHDPLAHIRIESGPAEPPPIVPPKPQAKGRSRLPLYGLLALLLLAGAGAGALYSLGYFSGPPKQLAETPQEDSSPDMQPVIAEKNEAPSIEAAPAEPPTPGVTQKNEERLDKTPTEIVAAPPGPPPTLPTLPAPEPVTPTPSAQAETPPAPEPQSAMVTPETAPPIAPQPESPVSAPEIVATAPEEPDISDLPLKPIPDKPVAQVQPLPEPEVATPIPTPNSPPPKEVAVIPLKEKAVIPEALPRTGQGSSAPKPSVSPIDKRLAWLSAFDAGGCFFAHAVTSSPNTIEIEGMAASAAPFDTLDTGFIKAFGYAPDIQGRQIAETQCGVASFLSGLSRQRPSSLSITLERDELKNGDALKGALGNLTKKVIVLYLVDNDGIVYRLDSLLQRSGSHGSFTVERIEQPESEPRPQLVLALSSDAPIPGSQIDEPAENAAFLQRLGRTIAGGSIDVDYGFAFFLLGGQ